MEESDEYIKRLSRMARERWEMRIRNKAMQMKSEADSGAQSIQVNTRGWEQSISRSLQQSHGNEGDFKRALEACKGEIHAVRSKLEEQVANKVQQLRKSFEQSLDALEADFLKQAWQMEIDLNGKVQKLRADCEESVSIKMRQLSASSAPSPPRSRLSYIYVSDTLLSPSKPPIHATPLPSPEMQRIIREAGLMKGI